MLSIHDSDFIPYGQVLSDYDFNEICEISKTDAVLPMKGTIYEAKLPAFEKLKIADELKNRVYGGMDIQIGYCSGQNSLLNGLEYHRGSEVIIAATPLILLLASLTDIKNHETIDSSKVKAFYMNEKEAVELYSTTLHFAPCRAVESGFMAIIVLPNGTNTPLKQKLDNPQGEDKLLAMTNKWLITHPESDAAKNGAFIGITGDNLQIAL